jgi:hypothetical protein
MAEAIGDQVIDWAKKALRPFLRNNPGIRIDSLTLRDSGVTFAVLYNLWTDPSVANIVAQTNTDLITALNAVYLPPRYSAIYHRRTRKMEVIWTAYALPEDQREAVGREFDLTVNGVEHHCRFGASSDRLLTIAAHSAPIGVSDSDFRNLRSFLSYNEKTEEEEKLGTFGEPISFWVENVTWEDEKILELVRHINFYLRYYDAESPVVVIHPQKPGVKVKPRTRYFDAIGFPPKIDSPPLDQNLLVLWGASFGTTRSANFLNFYRTIEYVALEFSQEKARSEIRDIIKQPHVRSDLDKASREVLQAMRTLTRQREQDRIKAFITETISPNLIWREVSQNEDFFRAPTVFEGGLAIEPLIGPKDTEETFLKPGVERFATSITELRNAMAHGKDTVSLKTMLPTAYNFDLLEPWINLVAVAAGQVVLFEAGH